MWNLDLTALAILDEPVRARLYRFVRAAPGPVSREEAAAAAGISRKLAAFHLEKLLEHGLVTASYATPASPRPGRAPKLYAVSDRDFAVAIPDRRYDFLSEVLIEAMETWDADDRWKQTAIATAELRGVAAGEEIQAEYRLGRTGPERALTALQPFLEQMGFEPERRTPHHLVLRNCPFRALANQSPGLVCRMNQGYLDGLIKGLGSVPVRTVFNPGTSNCCVELSGSLTS